MFQYSIDINWILAGTFLNWLVFNPPLNQPAKLMENCILWKGENCRRDEETLMYKRPQNTFVWCNGHVAGLWLVVLAYLFIWAVCTVPAGSNLSSLALDDQGWFLLNSLGWDNLSVRRAKQKANLMYKCINNLAPAYLCNLFAPFLPAGFLPISEQVMMPTIGFSSSQITKLVCEVECFQDRQICRPTCKTWLPLQRVATEKSISRDWWKERRMESHTSKQCLLNKVAAIAKCKEWFLEGPYNCFKQPSIVLALKEVVYDAIVVDWREYFVKIRQLSPVLCWVGANDTLTCVCYNIEGHSTHCLPSNKRALKMSYKKMAYKSQPSAWEQIHSKKYQDCPLENPTSFVCAEILYSPEVYCFVLHCWKSSFTQWISNGWLKFVLQDFLELKIRCLCWRQCFCLRVPWLQHFLKFSKVAQRWVKNQPIQTSKQAPIYYSNIYCRVNYQPT